MRPTDRLPTMLLATLKAGMAYLPLDPGFPIPRVKHILEEAEPLLVIAEEGGEKIIPPVLIKIKGQMKEKS